jgi:RNA polymerase sigma-70 factor (ECF subfamily)
MSGSHSKTRPTDRERFEALAIPLLPSLYATARRLTRRPEDAADLVLEAVLRAYRTFASFEDGTNAKAWLLTILYSVFTNVWRRERRWPEPISIEALEERFQREFEIPDRDAHHRVVRAAEFHVADPEVARGLEALPERFRLALLLVDVEELSYEESAAVCACPLGTLRSRLFRARRALAVALRDYARRTGYVKE